MIEMIEVIEVMDERDGHRDREWSIFDSTGGSCSFAKLSHNVLFRHPHVSFPFKERKLLRTGSRSASAS